ncbi:uncharacterized protein LOC105848786 isoform X2 [Hydra vulgaris]|uniref:uncharacterized protein LOC105848786 isoform X2 n=1 Tax=Hydra vulgaris TaxID=6087 RepID=UPI001F5EEA30|nr:uncharacterized protein LOC105848786 [Hydra vulgaris]
MLDALINFTSCMFQINILEKFYCLQEEHDVTDDLLALLSEECNKLRPDVYFLKSQIRLIIGTLKKHCQNSTVKDVLDKFSCLKFEKVLLEASNALTNTNIDRNLLLLLNKMCKGFQTLVELKMSLKSKCRSLLININEESDENKEVCAGFIFTTKEFSKED